MSDIVPSMTSQNYIFFRYCLSNILEKSDIFEGGGGVTEYLLILWCVYTGPFQK